MSKEKNIDELTFEEALAELEEIVRKINSGEQSLEESVSAYERGMLLKKHCQQKLDNAKMKVKEVVDKGEGNVETKDFNLE